MKLRAKFAVLVVGMLVVPLLVVSLGMLFRSLLAETSDAAPSYLRQYRTFKVDLERSLGLGVGDLDPRGPKALQELTGRLQGSAAVVLDSDGTVLMSTLAAPVAGERLTVDELIAHTGDSARKSLLVIDTLSGPDGRNGLFLFMVPRDPALRSIVAIPNTRALPVVKGLSLGLIAAGSLLLFATLTSILIVRSMTRSVTQLEIATRRIAEGDLAFELAAHGRDEIASLTGSFEHMRRALLEEEGRRARFLAGVSHDLKTPLALIQGYVEAIADGYAEGKPETLDRYLGIVREKSRSLEGMIDSLIDFARMETGEWRLTHHRVRAGAFFRDMGRRFAEDALLLGRALSWEVRIPEEIELSMDEALVTRALENLVGNALRYTEPEGSTHMAADHGDDGITLRIRDSGRGIPTEEIDRIFDPFFRGSGSRREEGHGLGLAVVKWVIESHGWTIGVSSSVGRGTEFCIRIPLEPAAGGNAPTRSRSGDG